MGLARSGALWISIAEVVIVVLELVVITVELGLVQVFDISRRRTEGLLDDAALA